ncbi:hypothetical protein K437DRAFT_276836 [Tilletiaria anomala UBC 951]|uniref:Cation-transporting ATPase n=1 Tax=Tilletiaria anomala (strain ATCC 24038 / CBS 436.72 / UBC 951) TaxID=1037660 RepID=A0A066VCM8_TILAU|nr:uncharacterized protein K437DRAFT_276836 [Tilletiaria anomala UBC 951]KDN36320.1 hypothetical protein K437DRAFT_276836 [Tilletiaria anomala UBC 951]
MSSSRDAQKQHHAVAEDRYQAPFAWASRKRSDSQVVTEDPLSDAEQDHAQASDEPQAPEATCDEVMPSSPYFDDKEAAEAVAWIRSGAAPKGTGTPADDEPSVPSDYFQDGGCEDDDSAGISIMGKKRRDSQVGSYDGGGSIFDGPSAGAIPSSMSSMRRTYARPELSARASSSLARRRISREFSRSPSAHRGASGRARKTSIDSVNSQAVSIGASDGMVDNFEPGDAGDNEHAGPSSLRRVRTSSFTSNRSNRSAGGMSMGFGRKRRVEPRDEFHHGSHTQSKGILGSIISSLRGSGHDNADEQDGGEMPSFGRRTSISSNLSPTSRRSARSGNDERDSGERYSDSDSDGYGLTMDDDEDDDLGVRSASSSDDGDTRDGGLLPSAFGTLSGAVDPVFGDSRYTIEHLPEDDLAEQALEENANAAGGFSGFGGGTSGIRGLGRSVGEADVEAYAADPLLQAKADEEAARARENLAYLDKSSCSRQQVYLAEEDTLIRFTGYRIITSRRLAYITLCILTLGIVYLVMRWLPRLRLKWLCKEAEFAIDADFVVVENQWGDLFEAKIETVPFARPLAAVFPHCTSKDPASTQAEYQAHVALHSQVTSKNVSAASSLRKGKAGAGLPMNTGSEAGALEHHINALSGVEAEQLMELSYLEYRYTRFALHPPTGRFRMIKDWRDPTWTSVSAVSLGVPWDGEKDRKTLFGANVIDIAAKSSWTLLVDEVLHPFYMFQIVSIVLWSFDNYYYYAFCIALISIVSILTTLLETMSTIQRMREMSRFSCAVRVLREGQWMACDSSQLVPGDVYDVAESGLLLFPADSVLLTGDAIVNESMLTGESVPVSKVPITDSMMASLHRPGSEISADLAKHFLFGGTRIIRIRGTNGLVPDTSESGAKAMVVRTGFDTTKGALIRSMLFPKPMGFKFYRDSFRFIGFLAGIACIGFLVSAANFVQIGIAWHTIVVRALDLITVVVPPALPATMSVGTAFAIQRLRKNGIFCISPNRVNIGGKVNVFCFDKTGTLTADGLDVLGTRTIDLRGKRFSELHETVEEMPVNTGAPKEDTDARKLPLLYALATCHSLKVVDGEVIGDPLDVKMFEYTGWTLDEGKDRMAKATTKTGTAKDGKSRLTDRPPALVQTVVRPPGGQAFEIEDAMKPGKHAHFLELGVLRTFEFVSHLRRMSVVVKRLKSESMEVFVKGAPEVMTDICIPESFPADYDDLLAYYTKHGYRVIACAGKSMPRMSWIKAQRLRREQAESGLRFLGLIIFENKIKEGTPPAIEALREASIICKMVTGDNPRTAISVARECGMVGQSAQVFIPNFLEGNAKDARSTLEWFSVDDERINLDSHSLKPIVVDPHVYDFEEFELQDYQLALTGEVFRWMVDFAPIDTLRRMLIKGTIFARMSPDEKHELIERLQALGYTVGMCGDGANDCGALKAADIGISLSEAEASVAAPFTSRSPDISCVIEVIKEGRAALVTSFSCFKYMALYSLIQFTSITILYSFASSLGDFQFLYIDLFIILPVAVAMARTLPFPQIHPKRPTANLVSKKVLVSMVGQVLICSVAQLFVFYYVRKQPWYMPAPIDPDELNVVNPENSALFFVSSFQYILVAAVFSVGAPYRKPMYTNPMLVISLTALTAFSLYCLFSTSGYVFDLLGLVTFPPSFHWLLFGVVLLNTGVSFAFESWAIRPTIRALKALQRAYMRVRYGRDGWRTRHRSHDSKLYKAVAAGMARDGQA